MLKKLSQVVFIPLSVVMWLFSMCAIGFELHWIDGTHIKLRGWWRE
jgi:hypothetical protein